jgi:hypothetical protein
MSRFESQSINQRSQRWRGLAMERFAAARVKLISSATITKAAKSFSSSRFLAASISEVYVDCTI